MKNLFCVLVFLAAGVLNAQQMAFNFVEITAKENSQDKIAELFDEFFGERERKSGASFLNAYVTVARMDEPIELYFFGS